MGESILLKREFTSYCLSNYVIAKKTYGNKVDNIMTDQIILNWQKTTDGCQQPTVSRPMKGPSSSWTLSWTTTSSTQRQKRYDDID